MTVADRPKTIGSDSFDHEQFLEQWSSNEISAPKDDNLETSIKTAFNLPHRDTYVYHAIASVTLAQVQEAIRHGGASGMHAWYKSDDGNQIAPPPSSDVAAYISVFSPTTSTSKALTALASNAKKDSLRASIASNLQSKRTDRSGLTIPKLKAAPPNPYLDYWAWSCHNLEWAGPDANTVKTKQSHHILPIFYHHFGCICPSFEALNMIQQLSRGRHVIDAGSGNGYWTFMLRRSGVVVHAIDNGDSLWRTSWIGDTIRTDAAKYLQRKETERGRNAVLLLVYPQASGSFTSDTLKAYEGDTVCVAGTQNDNRFTGFRSETVEEWMGREIPGFEKVVQTPLPSFAGKDEAFFVFRRRMEG